MPLHVWHVIDPPSRMRSTAVPRQRRHTPDPRHVWHSTHGGIGTTTGVVTSS